MVKSKNLNISFRPMRLEDINLLISVFQLPWLSNEKSIEKWAKYYQEQQENTRIAYLIEKQSNIIGYASLLLSSKYLNFKNNNISEINDLRILTHEQNQGFGTLLIEYIEN